MYSSLTLLQDVLFSKLHYPYLYYGLYYKPSEFGSVMLSLLNNVDSFEKIITYMLLLQADYTTDIDFHNLSSKFNSITYVLQKMCYYGYGCETRNLEIHSCYFVIV